MPTTHTPIQTGRLPVGDGHTLYYEVHGNPKGKPAVMVHGGPGGGLHRATLAFFDLRKYCVLLYDQRGCGKSRPLGSLKANTTWHLVDDLERLRTHLGIEQWLVLGGSWGTTLGIAYAETYPASVSELVLRSVCLLGKDETDWLYKADGAAAVYPEDYESFRDLLKTKAQQRNPMRTYKSLLHSKNAKTRKAASKAWWGWESAVSYLKPKPDDFTEEQALTIARIENHYFTHGAWLKPRQLLDQAHKLTMPVTIIHGRYDLVCPIRSSFALKAAVPHATLVPIPGAGHAGMEPGTKKALRKATDKYAA